MAQAIILGSGTSTGVPIPGYDYLPEFLSNPKNHRTRPALLVEGPTGNLLVDCGPDLRHQLLRENVKRLEAVVLTHSHADHLMGMDDLRGYSLKQQQSIPIYTLPRYQEDIGRVFPYVFQVFPEGIEVPRIELHDIPETATFGGLDFRFFTVMHGDLPVTALRTGDFAYVTDVKTVPEASIGFLFGLDVLVLDAVRLKPHRNHMNLDEALEFVERVQPKRTYLTHLSHDYDHDQTNASLPDGVQLAYDGLRIPL